MPVYEYRCTTCNTKFEKLVRSMDTVSIACPNCGSAGATKLFSTFAAFVGNGNGSAAAAADAPAPRSIGGGCCGMGGCGCC